MSREGLLLKVGVVMMTLALALVAVVMNVALRGAPEEAAASETMTKTSSKPSAEPLIRDEPPLDPWVEKQVPLPTAEVAENEPDPEASASTPKPELAPEAKPKSQSQSPPTPEPQESQSPPTPEPRAQPEQEQQTLPAGDSGWSRPTNEELEAANNPRHYVLPSGAIMALTIPGMGIYDAPVFDSASQWALTNGVAHEPETSLPWSQTPERNVYLAGHRMGYSGTWSRMLFYHLNKLDTGDEVLLNRRNGKVYRYRVSEVFVADPADAWVMGRIRGRDMVTLQTCTPIPTFEKRLIVRADRI